MDELLRQFFEFFFVIGPEGGLVPNMAGWGIAYLLSAMLVALWLGIREPGVGAWTIAIVAATVSIAVMLVALILTMFWIAVPLQHIAQGIAYALGALLLITITAVIGRWLGRRR